MKHLTLFFGLSLLAQGALASSFPECLKGKLKLSNSKEHSVLIVFGEKYNNLQYVDLFKINGLVRLGNSGRYMNSKTLRFNTNDDFIPGGNASYNLDIELTKKGEKVFGTYKQYEFEDGYGGFGESEADDLKVSGAFELEKCNL